MKKFVLAAAVAAAFATHIVHADEAAPAAAVPENTLSFNVAAISDYRYRGISQTRLQPALQGGADYVNNPTGLYAGAWASTITWIKDAGGDGSVELDLYAGKRGQLSAEVSYDVGVLTYVYASNALPVSANTTEVYGQLGYGPAYLKYSHAVTNLFGFADSKNSGYVDLGANLDAGDGYTINLHAGRQDVRHNDAASYTDWKLGVSKDFGVLTGALALIGTNANESAYTSAANGKFLGKNAVQLTVSKVF
ncbi:MULTISPECIES: TorF family putative porin [unclassified Duganella]|jgi:uncharacterized protein (TIGR02001 family)|uniref:TorF family putative porin n=1 Tax=unclassified Duganella TaxID=2636909 RepID=UPI00088CF035|nr:MULTISPECIES: TorF family putative porin [unclassified Duganella]SDG25926.1 conserved hypothetical protein [Duganella sp. OV458]SDJ22092.1 conserved hypothetical protein [Duganella sp. OV510]